MTERSINQMKCEHEWLVMTGDQRNGPGVAECKKCKLWLTHSNRLQLDMNNYTLRFQKRISITTIVISILALALSIAVAIWK